MEKPENIFPDIDKDDVELLHKMLRQMDAQEEGVRVAAVNVITRLFQRKGYNWAHVANAVEYASYTIAKGKMKNDATATHSTSGFTKPQSDDLHQSQGSGRERKKAETFIPGIHDIHIVDSMWSNGRLRVIMKLGTRVIRAYVTDVHTAKILRMSKGKKIRAHVRNKGGKWILGEVIF